MRTTLVPRRQRFFCLMLLLVGPVSTLAPVAAQDLPGDFYVRAVPEVVNILFIPVQYDEEEPWITQAEAQASAGPVTATYLANSYGRSVPVITTAPVLTVRRAGDFPDPDATKPWDIFLEVYQDIEVAAAAAMVNLDDYDYHVVFLRKIWNGTTGYGLVGYPAFVSARSTNLIEHELGHVFGLGHAKFQRVLGEPRAEYGDRFDIMGSKGGYTEIVDPRHLNSRSKTLLGWLEPDRVYRVTEPGLHTVTLRGIAEDPATTGPGEYTALEIPKAPGESYWVFLRADQPLVQNGPVVTYNNPRAGTVLLDMTPNSGGGWMDAALPTGDAQHADPNAGFVLRNLGVSGSEVTVSVEVSPGAALLSFDAPPIVDLLNPTIGETVSGLVQYYVTAFDPDVGPYNGDGITSLRIEFRKITEPESSEPIEQAVYGTEGPPYVLMVNTLGLPNGTYYVDIIAEGNGPTERLVSYEHWVVNP